MTLLSFLQGKGPPSSTWSSEIRKDQAVCQAGTAIGGWGVGKVDDYESRAIESLCSRFSCSFSRSALPTRSWYLEQAGLERKRGVGEQKDFLLPSSLLFFLCSLFRATLHHFNAWKKQATDQHAIK